MDTTNTTQHESLMTMAVNANKDTVNITDVKSGLQSDAFCVVCNSTLIAKKGEINAHHFAHTNGTECKYWRETFIHLAVKKYLSETLKITLPKFVLDGNVMQNATCFEFVDCVVENRIDNIIPDIVLIEKNGGRLLVEIAVTHFCDKAKVEKIRELNISCIEINFSAFKHCTEIDYKLISDILNKGHRMEWLYHRKISAMKYELISIDKQCSDAVNTLKELTMQLTNVIESKFDVALITAVLTDNFGVLNKSCCPTNKYNCLNCEFMLNSTSKGANSTQIFVECAGLNPADFYNLKNNKEKSIANINAQIVKNGAELKELRVRQKGIKDSIEYRAKDIRMLNSLKSIS